MFLLKKPDGWETLPPEEQRFFRSLKKEAINDAFIDTCRQGNAVRLDFLFRHCSEPLLYETIEKIVKIALLQEDAECLDTIFRHSKPQWIAVSQNTHDYGRISLQRYAKAIVKSPKAALLPMFMEWQEKKLKPIVKTQHEHKLLSYAGVCLTALKDNKENLCHEIMENQPSIVQEVLKRILLDEEVGFNTLRSLFEKYKDRIAEQERTEMLKESLDTLCKWGANENRYQRIHFIIEHGAAVDAKTLWIAIRCKDTNKIGKMLQYADPAKIDVQELVQQATLDKELDPAYVMQVQRLMEDWKKKHCPKETVVSPQNGIVAEHLLLSDGSRITTVFNFNSCQQMVSLYVPGQPPAPPAIVRFDDIQGEDVLTSAAETFVKAGGDRSLAERALPQKRPLKVG